MMNHDSSPDRASPLQSSLQPRSPKEEHNIGAHDVTISSNNDASASIARTAEPPQEDGEAQAEAYELANVHEVYSQIASHFSATRYKPWPIIESFLKDLPTGSVGLDVGCGNGKYLGVRDDIFILASDRSPELIAIASSATSSITTVSKPTIATSTNNAISPSNPNPSPPHTALTASLLSLPHPRQRFDFAICIAVIHHLSTRARRVSGIRGVLECLRPTVPSHTARHEDEDEKTVGNGGAGEGLFFVWALEQESSRRGWGEGCEQDRMVPWVLKGKNEGKEKKDGGGGRKEAKRRTKKRKDGKEGTRTEMKSGQDGSVAEANNESDGVRVDIHGGEDIKPGNNAPNAPNAHVKDEEETGLNHATHQNASAQSKDKSDHAAPKVFNRYYHLYKEGELEEDIAKAGGIVVRHGYERDNWWCVARWRRDGDEGSADVDADENG